MLKYIAVLLSALSLLLPASAGAQELAPDALVKNVTSEVLTIIRQDKDIQSGNTKRVIELVEQKVLPHFNFLHMTALAVGRDWRQATPEQQKVLADEFRTLLVRTYSTALTQYKNQNIDFKPFRTQPSDTDVLVRTEVKQSGAKSIGIDYSLEKANDSWKVYDIVVEGVSLVTNYRSEFGNEVRNSGIDGLIKSLRAKNRSPETASAPAQQK